MQQNWAGWVGQTLDLHTTAVAQIPLGKLDWLIFNVDIYIIVSLYVEMRTIQFNQNEYNIVAYASVALLIFRGKSNCHFLHPLLFIHLFFA
jgi:hypothetical protein